MEQVIRRGNKGDVSMKTILISPYSKKLRNGKENPKNFPYWEDVVKQLKEKGYNVIQVGLVGEKTIGANEVKFGLPLRKLADLLNKCHTWVSVDNFFQHFAYITGKKGVVVFGQSDPEIFGHKTNINLLKDRSYLREKQFDIWEACEYKEAAFVGANEVVQALDNINREV